MSLLVNPQSEENSLNWSARQRKLYIQKKFYTPGGDTLKQTFQYAVQHREDHCCNQLLEALGKMYRGKIKVNLTELERLVVAVEEERG